MIDGLRLMRNKATDVSTGGRNFSNHYCYPQWNVVPISSVIGVQYAHAIGTAIAQKRRGSKGISIVTGGDAGSAEGEFASSLVWASRKGHELPMLITVTNNGWGISTCYDGQHPENPIADRARGLGIKSETFDGNDPIESYFKIEEAMNYIRETGKPYFLEAMVSRLNGHSSATGAKRIEGEPDCIRLFEEKLVAAKILNKDAVAEVWEKYEEESAAALEQVEKEAEPTAESIWNHVYAENENADWRKF